MHEHTRVASEEVHGQHLKAQGDVYLKPCIVTNKLRFGFSRRCSEVLFPYRVLHQIGRLVLTYVSPMFTSLYFVDLIFLIMKH